MTAQLLYIDEAAYHADPCEAPSLSSSIAKTLLDKSPLHAWQEHPKLGGAKREATPTLERGQLIHKLVLGEGAEVDIIIADDWRTKKAKEVRDESREAGRIPVLAAAYDDAIVASLGISKNLTELGVVFDGQSEATLIWQDRSVTGEVWARGRLDHLRPNGTIYDLKTSYSAHPRSCVNHILEYGYDIQRAAYVRGVEKLMPHLAGRTDFVFLFAECEPPYAVTPMRLPGVMRERGDRRWEEAIATWARCLRTQHWPSYVTEIVTAEPPGWLLARMQEEAA